MSCHGQSGLWCSSIRRAVRWCPLGRCSRPWLLHCWPVGGESCVPCSASCFAGACIQSGMSLACWVPLFSLPARPLSPSRLGHHRRNIDAYTDWLGIGVALVSTIIIVGLFEEVGWRGFALPRLQRRLDAVWGTGARSYLG